LNNVLDDHLKVGPLVDASEGNEAMEAAAANYKTAVNKIVGVPGARPVAAAAKPAAAKAAAKADDKKDKKKDEKKDEKEAKKDEPAAAPAPVTAPAFQATGQIQYGPPPAMPAYGGGVLPPPPTANSPVGATVAAAPEVSYGNENKSTTNTNISTWTSTLVDSPTATEMQDFVSLYTSKQVTTAQFYQVLDAMEKSSVALSRQFAVQAAGLYQTSESFQLLSDESVTETNGTIQSLAQQDLMAYGNANELSILSSALQSGDVNQELTSSSLIKTIVSGYTTGQVPASVAQSLNAMIPILTTLSQTASSAQANAAAALQAIQTVVG
jgi:hypothetical protein